MKQVNLRIYRMILPLLFGLFLSVSAFAQQISVKGHVKDATGEPVIGANVVVKGTTNGTITDLDGNFNLNAPLNSTISVTFVGYKPAEVLAAKSVVVTLADDSQLLEAVVVIGYGTVKKNDLTGSVTAIKPDKMNRGLTTNVQDMMAGKMAGVSVISSGGAPGAGATIRVRGGSSLSASNDPLIVIDGLAMDNDGIKGISNPLSTVNPNDIESLTVLKDASATAIYGSRASNGVIIITTKKGDKNSRPRVSYDGNVSVGVKRNSIDVLDASQFRSVVAELYGEDSDAFRALGNEGVDTDWQKEIFRTAVSTDHNIAISGGLKNMPYRVSLGYTNQNGILKTSNFERYTAGISVNPSFFDNHLNLNLNAKGMISNNRFADSGVVGAAISMDPTKPVMVSDPIYNDNFGGYFQWYNVDKTLGPTFNSLAPANPVASLMQKSDKSHVTNFIGNAQFDYKFHFLPELRANLNLALDYSDGEQTTNQPKESTNNNHYGYYGVSKQYKSNMGLDFYLQYSKDFTNQHFDVMGGYAWQHFYRGGSDASRGQADGFVANYGEKSSVWKTESYLVSFFGRVNYSLFDRYLVTATVREDGTSRFSKNNRWGLFPSVALGWKLKEEAFLKDVEVLSDLKLRLGYGVTGQQNINQGDYPYIPVYSANKEGTGAYYMFGNEYYSFYRPDAYNQDLKWEETTTWNAGFDFGFLDGRITGSIDYYKRITNDLLNIVDVSAGTNFKNRVISNIGSLENQGVEFAINAKAISTNQLKWDVGFNITYNNNEITKLITGDTPGYKVWAGGISKGTGENIQAHAEGHPANSFYVYQQVYDQTGAPMDGVFVDRDGNGVINDSDRYFYKSPSAPVLMGFNSRLIWNKWDFSFSLRASLDNYVYNDSYANKCEMSATSVWAPSGLLTNLPSYALEHRFKESEKKYYLSDYFVENASFLRCDNITLGYTFQDINKRGIDLRLYGTVQNPFVITKYKGLDPEVSGGIDRDVYPRPLVSLVGLTLTF